MSEILIGASTQDFRQKTPRGQIYSLLNEIRLQTGKLVLPPIRGYSVSEYRKRVRDENEALVGKALGYIKDGELAPIARVQRKGNGKVEHLAFLDPRRLPRVGELAIRTVISERSGRPARIMGGLLVAKNLQTASSRMEVVAIPQDNGPDAQALAERVLQTIYGLPVA